MSGQAITQKDTVNTSMHTVARSMSVAIRFAELPSSSGISVELVLCVVEIVALLISTTSPVGSIVGFPVGTVVGSPVGASEASAVVLRDVDGSTVGSFVGAEVVLLKRFCVRVES